MEGLRAFFALGLQAGTARLSNHRNRPMLPTMLASVIVVLARARPMVRMISPIRSFWWPKTCSTFERTTDLRPFAQDVLVYIGRPPGFLRWISLTMPLAASQASFSTDR
ncbi:hypothetical protein BV379_10360 [Rhodovulum sulfidophilum]|nr:hypothetical protein BV379_10360 [Rhodovulum sulfidophilum]